MQLGLPFSTINRRGGARVGGGAQAVAGRVAAYAASQSGGASRSAPSARHAACRVALPAESVRRANGAGRAAQRADFGIIHYSIQSNHLHLRVEAGSARSLSSGMRGLAVRLARRINRLLFRRGQVWLDRWHGNELSSPRQVRNALVYVLQNRAKHAPGTRRGELDSLSSAAGFDGFASRLSSARAGPAATARTCY